VGVQMRDRGHDLGDAGLVVGAQQRVARGGHDVVARARGEVGLRRRIEPRAVARQRDRGAVVVAMDDRHDAGAGGVRARVHVGDQPDDGARVAVTVTGSGQRRRDVAVGVDGGIGQPDVGELPDEQRGELELARRAGAVRPVARGLRVDADVAVKARQQIGRQRFGEGGGVVRHADEP
jgi:hypothetical protein